MGGRSAEEIFLDHITTGAGNDIERATEIARKMVCEWGMSSLGPLAFGKKEEADFPGPRNRPAPRLLRRHRHPDRCEVRASSTAATNGQGAALDQSRHTGAHRAGAARSRSAGRQRIQAADGRQAAAGKDSHSASATAASGAQRRSQGGPPRTAARSRLHPRRKPREGLSSS